MSNIAMKSKKLLIKKVDKIGLPIYNKNIF